MALKHHIPATSTVSRNKVLIAVAALLTLISATAPAYFVNHYIFHLPVVIILLFLLIPVFSILFSLLKSGLTDIGNKITLLKYHKFFPFVFYYDPGPKIYKFKNVQQVDAVLQQGDILLRRHDNYIDGLILRQSSYFTHAAICADDQCSPKKIIHELGKGGVQYTDLDTFSKCDEIAVLRFADLERMDEIDRRPVLEHFSTHKTVDIHTMIKEIFGTGEGAWSKRPEQTKNVRNIIEHERVRCPSIGDLPTDEMKIYDLLSNRNIVSRDIYIPVIMRAADNEYGIPYDFDFNFKKFKKFSCVSFVWYSFKSLFPVHQVKIGIHYYFYFIKTYVMVPDSFLYSNAFKLIYFSDNNNNPGIEKKPHLNFWLLIAETVLKQIILLALIAGLFTLL